MSRFKLLSHFHDINDLCRENGFAVKNPFKKKVIDLEFPEIQENRESIVVYLKSPRRRREKKLIVKMHVLLRTVPQMYQRSRAV